MRPLVASKYNSKEPDLPKGGFGSYSLEYMNQTGQNFIFHGILPDEGGWNDQDAEWCDALMNWLGYWDYLDWEFRPDPETPHTQNQNEDEESTLDILMQFDDESPDWQSTLRDR